MTVCPSCQTRLPDGYTGERCPHCDARLAPRPRTPTLNPFTSRSPTPNPFTSRSPTPNLLSSRPPAPNPSGPPPRRDVTEDRWDVDDAPSPAPYAAPTPAPPPPPATSGPRSVFRAPTNPGPRFGVFSEPPPTAVGIPSHGSRRPGIKSTVTMGVEEAQARLDALRRVAEELVPPDPIEPGSRTVMMGATPPVPAAGVVSAAATSNRPAAQAPNDPDAGARHTLTEGIPVVTPAPRPSPTPTPAPPPPSPAARPSAKEFDSKRTMVGLAPSASEVQAAMEAARAAKAPRKDVRATLAIDAPPLPADAAPSAPAIAPAEAPRPPPRSAAVPAAKPPREGVRSTMALDLSAPVAAPPAPRPAPAPRPPSPTPAPPFAEPRAPFAASMPSTKSTMRLGDAPPEEPIALTRISTPPPGDPKRTSVGVAPPPPAPPPAPPRDPVISTAEELRAAPPSSAAVSPAPAPRPPVATTPFAPSLPPLSPEGHTPPPPEPAAPVKPLTPSVPALAPDPTADAPKRSAFRGSAPFLQPPSDDVAQAERRLRPAFVSAALLIIVGGALGGDLSPSGLVPRALPAITLLALAALPVAPMLRAVIALVIALPALAHALLGVTVLSRAGAALTALVVSVLATVSWRSGTQPSGARYPIGLLSGLLLAMAWVLTPGAGALLDPSQPTWMGGVAVALLPAAFVVVVAVMRNAPRVGLAGALSVSAWTALLGVAGTLPVRDPVTAAGAGAAAAGLVIAVAAAAAMSLTAVQSGERQG